MGAYAAPAKLAPVALGHERPDRLTLHVAPVADIGEGDAGLVHALLGGAHGGAEGGSDLLVVEAVELAHEQGASLALGELGNIGHQLAQALARGGVQRHVGAHDAGRGVEAATGRRWRRIEIDSLWAIL